MLKKSIIVASLIGLTWAGTAQAGFLGNNLELQLLQSGLLTLPASSVTVNTDPTNTTIENIDLVIGDTSLGLTGSADGKDLAIIDINDTLDPITGATGIGTGSVSYGTNNDGHQYVLISGLSGQIDTSVDVTFASTVPEPGAFDLMVLGLMMLGVTAYQQRRRVPARAGC